MRYHVNTQIYYNTFKDIMQNYYEAHKDKTFALFLSAGYDSRSILYMCKQLDIPIRCYTFTLMDRVSTDCRVAVSEAQICGYDYSVVYIPVDENTIISNLEMLARKYGCRLKTEFECVLPLYYLHRAVREDIIFVGTDADNYFACGSKYGFHYRKFGDYGLTKYKEDKPKNSDTRYSHQEVFADAEFRQRMLLCDEFNQIEFDPYNTKQMYNIFEGTNWIEVNKPVRKLPIYEAFEQEFLREPPYRTSYQCGDSGIRELCSDVLLNSKYNTRGYKSAIGCYNEIVRGVVNDRVVPKLF